MLELLSWYYQVLEELTAFDNCSHSVLKIRLFCLEKISELEEW